MLWYDGRAFVPTRLGKYTQDLRFGHHPHKCWAHDVDAKNRSLRHAVIDKHTCGKPMSTTRCITKFPARRSTPGGTKFSLGTNSSISMSDAVRNSMSLTPPACSISAQHTTVLDVTAGRDTNEIVVLVSAEKATLAGVNFQIGLRHLDITSFHVVSRMSQQFTTTALLRNRVFSPLKDPPALRTASDPSNSTLSTMMFAKLFSG